MPQIHVTPTFAEPAVISRHSDNTFNVLVQTANAHGIGVLVQEAITGNRAAAFLTLPQLRHMLAIAEAAASGDACPHCGDIALGLEGEDEDGPYCYCKRCDSTFGVDR
jgi:hypothetical protein